MKPLLPAFSESGNGSAKITYWTFTLAVLIGLYLTVRVNYLLFHSLVELFSIIIAATVFIITWNSVKYIKNPYLIMVGISFLFIGILDLLHTLSYKGMPIFTDYDFYANQLWIAARGLESCTLLAAFLLLYTNRTVKVGWIFALYTFITALLIACIFYWKIFPICFVEGKGLTAFKVYSEYVICAVLSAGIVFLIRSRRLFAESVYKLLLASMVCTIISELTFTFYISNFGISNIVGHYFKLFSFTMIYRAIVVTGIEEPYHLIFNQLNRTNDDFRKEIATRTETESMLEAHIQARKQAEIALKKREYFFKESQRAASIGSYVVDFVTGEWETSEVINKIFGIAPTYPRTVKNWLKIVHPDDRDMMDRYLNEEVIANRSLFSKEYRIIRVNDGETRWVLGLGEIKVDSTGCILSLTGTVQDITERMQSQAELQAVNIKLRDSRKATINMMQDAIISRKQAEELSDRLRHEVEVRKAAEDSLSILNNELENLVEARTKELQNAIETLKIATDERILAIEALREKEQMLIQQNRQAAMGEMISNIAHQWRQPLNTLGLSMQKLGLFYGSPDFTKEFLDTSIAKTMSIIRHMSKTIDDFRNYFKPEKEKSDFYVIEAINNTLILMEGSFQNPFINITVVEHANPVIHGYPNEFTQVLINILNNARDAIVEKDIYGAQIIVSVGSEKGCAVVKVSDNAGGISEEIISKVFDPYFTTKGPQRGTGIGLFMSKSIIEKNMGVILMVRNTDIGAEFRIEIAMESGIQAELNM